MHYTKADDRPQERTKTPAQKKVMRIAIDPHDLAYLSMAAMND